MTSAPPRSKTCAVARSGRPAWLLVLAIWVATFALLGAMKPAYAQVAPAGTAIGNQAAATYTDGSGTIRTATSNPVTTIVQQVASFTLTSDNAKPGAIGQPVYFPHTITNTGNGTDFFNLPTPTASGDFTPTNIAIYADANGDGVPDSATAITRTPNLAPGEAFNFVVAARVPTSGAAANDTATINVDATSNFSGGAPSNDPDGNDDVITVTAFAVVNVTKAIDDNTGPSLPTASVAANPQYTYTLTYTNPGRVDALNVRITDILDSRFDYVVGSGTWSQTPGTPLGDAPGNADDPAGITFDAQTTPGTVAVVINSIASGSSGFITFKVTVDKGQTAPQTIPNTATFIYNQGNGTDRNGSTNRVDFSVIASAGVTATSPPAITSAPQGSTISFKNIFTNTGNASDSFDIVVNSATSGFPSGTTYALYKSDDSTPLIDTNGNGIPDTGQVAAGASYDVYLQVTLPTTAPATIGPYSVTKTATSRTDSTKTATATDTLNGIERSSVDLTATNGPVGDNGTGLGPEAAGDPVITQQGNPGQTVRYQLSVTNTSVRVDNYDLSVSGARGALTGSLPAGFVVVFRDAAGGVITNTGNVAPNGTFNYFADVTIPARATPQDVELYFRVLSQTGATDRLFDLLQVSTVRGISVEPNNTGQTFPGSTIVYTHTVVNTGNVTEQNIALTAVNSNNSAGFTTALFADTNGNGILDAADTTITSIASLAPGASVTVFAQVFSPSGAQAGTQNITTLTATSAGAVLPNGNPAPGTAPTDIATDTTTIVAGQLRLLKEQALDANADGTPDGGVNAYSNANITTGAIPGAVIRYRITVTNIGTSTVSGASVSDSTPAYTVYDDGNNTNDATGVGRAVVVRPDGTVVAATPAPTNGLPAALSFNVGSLLPGQSAIVYFGARIQ